MHLALTAAAIFGILAAVTALSAPLIAWVDRRAGDITADRSRINSSVQVVVTTAAFATAYAVYPGSVSRTMVAGGIAVLFGIALGGEIQAERLHRASSF
ncbi:hypothetical protein CLV35_2970 [Motilibacter peucedani]|uniref:Uncharacterized protein n=1 Tax=Motilibacter peucedani TaxID=598650 RepID=A0A420XN70_9ACTN|nr:hypothetical protein [Motilibacter peucedani]RKS72721.1 hypothetical protein CLV35_2970 [Motilibacter peucedani]